MIDSGSREALAIRRPGDPIDWTVCLSRHGEPLLPRLRVPNLGRVIEVGRRHKLAGRRGKGDSGDLARISLKNGATGIDPNIPNLQFSVVLISFRISAGNYAAAVCGDRDKHDREGMSQQRA